MKKEQFDYIIKNNFIQTNVSELSFNSDDSFVFQKVINDNGLKVIVKDPATLKHYKFSWENITKIDGMDVDRFLISCEIDEGIETEHIDFPTDISKIEGHKHGVIGDLMLENDMRIIFTKDAAVKNNNTLFTVKGVGKSIRFSRGRGRPKTSQK